MTTKKTIIHYLWIHNVILFCFFPLFSFCNPSSFQKQIDVVGVIEYIDFFNSDIYIGYSDNILSGILDQDVYKPYIGDTLIAFNSNLQFKCIISSISFCEDDTEDSYVKILNSPGEVSYRETVPCILWERIIRAKVISNMSKEYLNHKMKGMPIFKYINSTSYQFLLPAEIEQEIETKNVLQSQQKDEQNRAKYIISLEDQNISYSKFQPPPQKT